MIARWAEDKDHTVAVQTSKGGSQEKPLRAEAASVAIFAALGDRERSTNWIAIRGKARENGDYRFAFCGEPLHTGALDLQVAP
jgi:hypothetical protein